MQARTIATVFLTACAAEPDIAYEDTALQSNPGGSLTNFCEHVTITGTAYYDDLRVNGRFDLRDHEPGSFGVIIVGGEDDGIAPGAQPYDPEGSNLDNVNYYGLRDAQIDIYEVDLNYGNGGSCSALAHAGTTTVQRDGTFTWTGDICETCGADTDGGQTGDLSVAVKVSLRNCDDPSTRCFSVRTPDANTDMYHYSEDWDGVTWAQWFTGATSTAPQRFRTQATLPVGIHRFETPGDPTSQPAKAANVFASMVDVTRKMHMGLGIEFGQPEVKAYFPSATEDTHSHESGRLCVKDPGDGAWVDGKEAPHEYGHLLHFWAWDNHGKWVNWCFDSNQNGVVDQAPGFYNECDESSAQQEYVNAALKEGWGDFILGVTLSGTGSPMACEARTVLRGCPGQTCLTGRHYFDDVIVTLCDVWDSSVDTQYRNHTHYYDHTDMTLLEIWHGLQDMWTHASPATRATVESSTMSNRAGLSVLGICDLMKELGPSEPSLEETLAVDGLDCGL